MLPKLKAKSRRGSQTDVTSASVSAPQIRPFKEIIYETPKREHVREEDDDDYDVEFLEEDARRFGKANVGPVASPYLMPYVYKRRFLDIQYGLRKGDSPVLIYQDSDIMIK